MGIYEYVCYKNAKDTELEQKHITYDMPSEQQINIFNTKVLQNHIEKKQNDCKVVFNQINKNLHHAVFSNSISEEYRTSFTHIFNSTLDMNISNCKGFSEYSKQLLDRGIIYSYVPNSVYMKDTYDIKYKPLEKTIYLCGH
jgi:hypothetical protein